MTLGSAFCVPFRSGLHNCFLGNHKALSSERELGTEARVNFNGQKEFQEWRGHMPKLGARKKSDLSQADLAGL